MADFYFRDIFSRKESVLLALVFLISRVLRATVTWWDAVWLGPGPHQYLAVLPNVMCLDFQDCPSAAKDTAIMSTDGPLDKNLLFRLPA